MQDKGKRADRVFLLTLLCCLGAVIPLYFNGLHTPIEGRDFTIIWLAGRAVQAGINPSNFEAFSAFGRSFFGNRLFDWSYPPTMLFVAVPISWLPHKLGFFVWNGVTLALFYTASRPFLPAKLRLLAVLTPAAILNMIFGQTGFLLGGLWFLAFRYAPLSALLLIKPHIGFLAGIRVLGDWKRALIGISIGVVIVVASALVFGGWPEFFAAGSFQAHAILDRRFVTWVLVATAPAVGYGFYGWLLFAIGAAWFLSRNFNVWTAATATMLISPYGYHYDMTVICAGFLVLLYERKMNPWETAVICIAFLSPSWVRVIGTWFVPPVLLAALAIQTSGARKLAPLTGVLTRATNSQSTRTPMQAQERG